MLSKTILRNLHVWSCDLDVNCMKLAELIKKNSPVSETSLDYSMIFFKVMHLNSSSFEWLKIKFFIPLSVKPNF